jgi:nitrate reductase gamma subunit
MTIVVALALVAGAFLAGLLGAAAGGQWVVGVAVPYLAATVFLVGLVVRALGWARVPVPFRIPTTCGQQRALDWIPSQRLENPHNTRSVLARMALEILCFRSLLRNTRTVLVDGRRLVYATDLSLWLGAIALHWAMLVVLIRHLRLVTTPVPAFVTFVEQTDGFLEIGMPVVYVTSFVLLAAVTYLLIRRLAIPTVRYISLVGDYFPLFLLLGIAGSGVWMRHLAPTDLTSVKAMLLGLTHFAPVVPVSVAPLFYGHLFLVSVLLAYFPFSKLLHAPGVFLSPTRNLANSNRAVRHVNPWDCPVAVHTYDEYEDEFREKMIRAGLPVERQ